MRRIILHLVLLLLLAASQEGALVHEIGHFAVAEAPQAATRHEQGKTPAHEKTCRLCVAFAQVGGAGPTTTHALPLHLLCFHFGVVSGTSVSATDRVEPRNRDPPAYA